MFVVGGFPQRIQRNRHRTDLDRSEERVDERRTVEQQKENPLLAPHADSIAQRRTESIDAFVHLPVGHPLVAALDGDFAGASLVDVPIDEVASRR